MSTRTISECVVLLLLGILAIACPNFAEAQQAGGAGEAEERGSVIVFPKFMQGMQRSNNENKPMTEIEVRAQCPRGAACTENEPVKIRFHWVCPGSDDIASKYICKEAGFEISLAPNSTVSFSPEDSSRVTENPAVSAPCPRGYLVGWVIDRSTSRPIKFDALSGQAILRDGEGRAEKYQAITIQAEPNLTSGADITTDIDPRTGAPALVFDGAAGHYQALGAAIPQDLEYRKLAGPLSSDQAFLVLLSLDVRLNRPNYPTFADLNFLSDQGIRASRSTDFTCWTEIENPKIDPGFRLAGAPVRQGLVLSGKAAKVPFGGISDIPGPVTLLGLVPSASDDGRSMDAVYVIKRLDNNKPMTVLLPFD
jgi:hypothetical protein